MNLPFDPEEEITRSGQLVQTVIAQNTARLITAHTRAHALVGAVPSGLKIMLVEDILINQRLLTRMLEMEGHEVAVAFNGLEAVELFPTAHWDAILMDVQMPTMSGLQATLLIRFVEKSTMHRVPIIAVSANTTDADIRACLAAGMDDFLPKPINLTDLRAMLAKYCGADTRPTIAAGL